MLKAKKADNERLGLINKELSKKEKFHTTINIEKDLWLEFQYLAKKKEGTAIKALRRIIEDYVTREK